MILFQAADGRAAVQGERAAADHANPQRGAAQPAEVRSPHFRDLETICLKCLEKEPDRRYATAHDVADELRLRRFFWRRTDPARPITAWERTWRWAEARPLAATLAGLLALVIVTTAAVAPFVAAHQAKLRHDAETLAGELEVSLEKQKSLTRAANVLRLAAQAKAPAVESPQRALLLASEAVDTNLRRDEPVVPRRIKRCAQCIGGDGATIAHSACTRRP